MNNSPDSAEVTKSNLRDPVTALPPEVLCYLFFSLGPFSIAASSAVSRVWRDVVLSDSTLHREIDLTYVVSRWEVMRHLVRLQSLSQNKLSKVILNVSSFWRGWIFNQDTYGCGNEEDEDVYITATTESLLQELQVSSGSLKEISLTLCESEAFKHSYYNDQDGPRDSDDALPFLSVILQALFDGAKFSGLKRISMKGPTYFEVEAGEDVAGSKHFSLQDISGSLERQGMEDDWSEDQMDQTQLGSARLALMKRIKEFTGSGLIKFGGGGSWVFREDHLKIMEELWLSSSTLQIIDLQVFDFTRGTLRDELWSRAVNCPTLSRFRLVGHKERDDEDSEYGYEAWDTDPLSEREEIEEKLEFSSDSKKLKIKLQIPRIAWESIADLVGNDLKELRFIFDPTFYGSSGEIPGFDSFIFRFHGSLKLLELHGISTLNHKSKPLPKPFFPNLKTLIISKVGSSILEFFSKITSSRLGCISITSASQTASTCLLSLLNLNSSNLVRLHFRASWNSTDQETAQNLSFSNLKYLRLSSRTSLNASAAAFFLQFTYPNIIKIEPASLKERFSGVAPKLVEAMKEVGTG